MLPGALEKVNGPAQTPANFLPGIRPPGGAAPARENFTAGDAFRDNHAEFAGRRVTP